MIACCFSTAEVCVRAMCVHARVLACVLACAFSLALLLTILACVLLLQHRPLRQLAHQQQQARPLRRQAVPRPPRLSNRKLMTP